ncbi:spherulation-specific family 4 protein [Streptomyces sp. AM6-12]|uniref:spherulation-specific family 4 protein n=1 Tax=Streptomyces sp. AM6-12 TaxID=3345149 RepID=UPI00378D979D
MKARGLAETVGAVVSRRACAVATGGVLAVGALVAAPTTEASAAGSQQSIAVPAYFSPDSGAGLWDKLASPAPGAGLAVANPQTGPGSGKDDSYAKAIQKAHSAGTKVVGYVDSGYLGTKGWTAPDGGTSVQDWVDGAKANVDKWFSWYGSSGIDGIFFDDGLTSCGTSSNPDVYVQAYKTLQAYVKSKDPGAKVVVNPGASPDECYTQAADTLVTFEGTYDDYVKGYSDGRQAWEASADPSKIWHLIHTTGSESQMRNAVSLSKQRNAGYVYVTDDDNTPVDGQQWGNPWDTLPAYWSDEVNAVAGGGSGSVARSGPVKSGIAGYCLDVPGDTGSDGAKVTIAPCDGSAGQQWTAGADGSLQIDGKCLDVTYGATANGSPVALYDCNGRPNQRWNVSGATLVGAGSGRCLDDPQFFTDSHQLDIWDCDGGNNQKWTLP